MESVEDRLSWMSKRFNDSIFGGRLAEYKYYDMRDTMESVMKMFGM